MKVMKRPAGIFSIRGSCFILFIHLSLLFLSAAQEGPSPTVEANITSNATAPTPISDATAPSSSSNATAPAPTSDATTPSSSSNATAPAPTSDATTPSSSNATAPAPTSDATVLAFGPAPAPSPLQAPAPSQGPGTAPPPYHSTPGPVPGKKSSSCSTGCIIGVIVGVAAGLAIILLAILAVCLVRRNRNKRPAVDYSYMVKPQEQHTHNYKSPSQGDYAAAVANKKLNTKTVCCRLRGVVRTGTILPNESGTSGYVRVHLGAHETVDLPVSEVMQLFAANEKVIYTNPTNGIEKMATIVRSDGTLWPPFYTVKIHSDGTRIETVQQQLRASS